MCVFPVLPTDLLHSAGERRIPTECARSCLCSTDPTPAVLWPYSKSVQVDLTESLGELLPPQELPVTVALPGKCHHA